MRPRRKDGSAGAKPKDNREDRSRIWPARLPTHFSEEAFLSGEDLVVYSRTPFLDALECLIHDQSNKCISAGPAFHPENDTDHTITITLGQKR